MNELAEKRHAVQVALHNYRMFGWLWEDHDLARPEPIHSIYLQEVENCDLYIGLLWLGYGRYTIEEFDYAHKEKHKPCLLYIKDVDTQRRAPKLKAFLKSIQRVENPNSLKIRRFKTAEELAGGVQIDVLELLIRIFRAWIQKTLPTFTYIQSGALLPEPYKDVTVNINIINNVNMNIQQNLPPVSRDELSRDEW